MALPITWLCCPISFCLKALFIVCVWMERWKARVCASELCVSVKASLFQLPLLLLFTCVCTCVNSCPLKKVVESQWFIFYLSGFSKDWKQCVALPNCSVLGGEGKKRIQYYNFFAHITQDGCVIWLTSWNELLPCVTLSTETLNKAERPLV